MKLIINFLLLSSLSILTEAEYSDEIRKLVLETIQKTNGTTSAGVKFHAGGELGKGTYSIVWKGDYNGKTLAFKLIGQEYIYQNEIGSYYNLRAVYNSKVEKHGIPHIYCHGDTILPPYWGIGMTLLEENLEERWELQKKNISELSILLIFKRGVEILKYLNKRKVIHNDIKPQNIFFRGSEVFLGDFNLAAVYGLGDVMLGRTLEFASSRFYAEKVRTFMDDLESLVFSLWSVAGIQRDKVNSSSTELRAEGETLFECKKNGTAESKMNTKCNGFQSQYVREAFQLIAAGEMLEEKHAPDYKKMMKILDKAIANTYKGTSSIEIFIKSTPKFEWLTGR